MAVMQNEQLRRLFTPIQLGGVTLKNRIIFLAHWTNFGNNHGYREDGLASERLAYHYIERAKGGAGFGLRDAERLADWSDGANDGQRA